MTRTLCRIAGILSLASLLLYAFMGVALWSHLTDDGTGLWRGMLLYIAHAVGLCLGLASLDRRLWGLSRDRRTKATYFSTAE